MPGRVQVGTALAGRGDPLALALPDQGTLELIERSRTDSSGAWRCLYSPVRVRCSLANCTRTLDRVGVRDRGAQVIKVAGQAVHRVHQDGVAVADEREHRLQLRAGGASADPLSVNVRSSATPSSWRSRFWSRLLTRV